MKIKILNKNRITDTGTYDISNLQYWNIDEGFTYTKTYNETLDSAVIRISQLTSTIDIEPFDEVLLYDDSRFENIYMCVDNYTKTQDSIGSETTYTYEIHLFSQTKLLENKILPNLTITKGSYKDFGTTTETDTLSKVVQQEHYASYSKTTTYTIPKGTDQIIESCYIDSYSISETSYGITGQPAITSYTDNGTYISVVVNYAYAGTETGSYKTYNGETDTITTTGETYGTITLTLPSEYAGYTLVEEEIEELDISITMISGFEEDVGIESKSFDSSTRTFTFEYSALTSVSFKITLTDIEFKTGTFLPDTIHTTINIATSLTYSNRSVQYYLEQYLNEYGEKRRVNGSFVNRFSYASRVSTKFSNILVPEMQWNNPTLREVITDLMMIGDCIPVVSNGTIDYLDLTQKGSAITNYNYIQESQSSDDYVSDIRMDLQNVMQTSIDGITNTTITTEYITLTSDDSVLTSDNGIIKTQFPILNVRHLWVVIPMSTTEYSSDSGTNEYYKEKFVSVDLCNIPNFRTRSVINNLVCEYKEYITKSIIYKEATDIPTLIFDRNKDISTDFAPYQNYNLYYERGSNVIGGLGQQTKYGTIPTGIIDVIRYFVGCNYLYENNLQSDLDWQTVVYYLSEVPSGAGSDWTRYSFPTTFFQIEYETMNSQSFSAGKGEYPTNYREIADNQTNSWVDSYNQGNLEYQKANRLGNKTTMINQRYVGSGSLMDIGNTYNNSIVYQVQYQVYADHIEVNGYATKDYILRNYYTGINSKIRTWKNATDEAVQKNELIKYYYEFSYSPHTEYDITGYSAFNTKYLLECIDDDGSYTKAPIKYALVRTFSGEYLPTSSDYYSLNLLSRIAGNSLVFSFGFDDNAYVGKHIRNSDDYEGHRITGRSEEAYSPFIAIDGATDYGGIPYEQYKYATSNTNYEMTNMDFRLGEKISIAEGSTDPFTKQDNLRVPILNVLGKPKVKSGEITGTNWYFNQSYTNHKDNREKPFFNLQLEFCTDDNERIYFTKYFLQRQKAINTLDRSQDYIYVYNSATYIRGSETLPSDAISMPDARISVASGGSGKYATLTLSDLDLEQHYVYIVDSDHKVLLCCGDNGGTTSITLYLNMLKQRNKNIYNSSGIKQGEI